MSKCKKIKNPCKICLSPVSRKNGVQCKGACQCWVHFSCLNYTPGKIKDIKNGIITVLCPCPDCKTLSRKEFNKYDPFSCSSFMCPANNPPLCAEITCPEKMGSIREPLMFCGTKCNSLCSSSSSSESDRPGISKVNYMGTGGGAGMSTVEQMCATVGQLAQQINELMTKMREASDGPTVCVSNKHSKSCFCPGNPRNKRK